VQAPGSRQPSGEHLVLSHHGRPEAQILARELGSNPVPNLYPLFWTSLTWPLVADWLPRPGVAARGNGSWKSFDSSSGFRLPDNSVLSPDASLVALDRWQALSDAERCGFAPLCPDLEVELANPSDAGPRGLTTLRQKMAAYQRNGARLGWLLIPAEQAVEIWGPLAAAPAQPRRLKAATRLNGDPQFPGLAINLEEIWAG
jgi:hypothetical protein